MKYDEMMMQLPAMALTLLVIIISHDTRHAKNSRERETLVLVTVLLVVKERERTHDPFSRKTGHTVAN